MAWSSWDDFPDEVQQKVLLRVPWLDLYLFRLVCKSWNSMIKPLKFASLHATSTARPEPCVISSIRQVDTELAPVVTENDPGWQLLNIAANRMLTIPDTFITEGLLRDAEPGTKVLRHTLVASGGLIHAVYVVDTLRSILNPHRVVCNPVSRSFHQIPALPPGGYHKLIGMVVDFATQRYRIVHIRGDLRALVGAPAYTVYLYDSWVRDWRRLCGTPGAARRPRSCVVLDGVVYVMFQDLQNRRNDMYTCDLETGEWRLIDVALPRPPLLSQMSKTRSQVVAAAGHLFFVGYSGPVRRDVMTLTVWRIFALGESRPRVTLVARLQRFLNYHDLLVKSMIFSAVAIGCGDSIVVSNFVGRRVRWDVLQDTWYRPMEPMTDGTGACHSFFVGSIDLQMRPMPPQQLGRL